MLWCDEFTTFERAVDAAEVTSSDWLKRHGRRYNVATEAVKLY